MPYICMVAFLCTFIKVIIMVKMMYVNYDILQKIYIFKYSLIFTSDFYHVITGHAEMH